MKFIGDISKLTWEKIEEAEPNPTPVIRLGFVDNGSRPVTFDNLSFGVNIFLDETQISSQAHPPVSDVEVVQYISTDEELMPERFHIIPAIAGRVYTFVVWAKNAGQHFSEEYKVMLPVPDNMNPSARDWDMVNKVYKTITPYPTEFPESNHYWAWDSETESWVQEPVPDII